MGACGNRLGIPGLNFSHDNTGSFNYNKQTDRSRCMQSSLEELEEFHDSLI
jgi:hypothetical protein